MIFAKVEHMNRGCIPLTKTPCKDAFKMFLKTKKFNEEQEKFLWIWRIAWIYGKQYAIQEEKILTNNGRTNCKLTNRGMKEIWNNIDMTGREFGKDRSLLRNKEAHDQRRDCRTHR
jgi:hypothetical protein